jgi:hypothetical protein
MRFTHSSCFAKPKAFSSSSHQVLSDYCVLSSDPHALPGSSQEDASLRRRRAYCIGVAQRGIGSTPIANVKWTFATVGTPEPDRQTLRGSEEPDCPFRYVKSKHDHDAKCATVCSTSLMRTVLG